MALKVICLGKTEKGLYGELIKEFLPRLNKYVSCQWEEVPGTKLKGNLEVAKEKESETILKKIRPQDKLCLLDEGGQQFTSRKFARWIDQNTNGLSGDLIFVIGSAYGFSDALLNRANNKVSLSNLTFNHQMVRGIFAEQLYRAYNILNGGTYHND